MISQIEEYLKWIEVDKSPQTLKLYRESVTKLINFFGPNDFEDIKKITTKQLRDFQYHLKSSMKETSVNSYMRPVKAMFNWFVKNEYLEKSPANRIDEMKTPKKTQEFLSEEEQSMLMNVCKTTEDRLIVAILVSIGLRRDELCGLKLSDYNGNSVRVKGKGDKERVLPLQDDVRELLDQYIIWRTKKYGNKTDALIVSRKGDHYRGDSIYKKLKCLLKQSGIDEDKVDRIHPHSLRHTCSANLLSDGVSIYVVSEILGHADISTTMIYSHLHNSAMETAIKSQRSIL
jgi:site-specific recombinase XerD